MYITRNKIQKLDCKRTWEMNFLSPFFTLEESQKLELCKSGLSAPTVEVLVQVEGVEFRTMAAMRIYARYFPVTFLAFFMSSSI